MEEFRKNFSIYSSVLSFTALCPYDESLLGKTRRVIVALLILCVLVVQVSTLRLVQISLYHVLMMLSLACPMVLYFLRYVGFAVHRSVMKVMFDGFVNDYSMTKNPVELDIFARHITVAKRVIAAYLGLPPLLIAYMTTVLLIPTILRSEIQLQYLHIFGFFFPEMSRQTDCVSILFVLVNVMGLLSLAITESAMAVISSYLCGLHEIASYRIEVAIAHMAHSTTSDIIQIRPAVEPHRRALNLLNYVLDSISKSYIVPIFMSIISFAVSLYRNAKDFANLFFSINGVLLHFLIIFLNNFSGQRVVNTSAAVFNKMFLGVARTQGSAKLIVSSARAIAEYKDTSCWLCCYCCWSGVCGCCCCTNCEIPCEEPELSDTDIGAF